MVVDIFTKADQFQEEFIAGSASAERQVRLGYDAAQRGIEAELDKILRKISEAEANGEPVSASWLFEAQRLQKLRAQTVDLIDKAARRSFVAVKNGQEKAAERGFDHTGRLVESQFSDTRIAKAELSGRFDELPKGVIDEVVGRLSDGSPLSPEYFGTGEALFRQFQDALIGGVAAGKNPNAIRSQIQASLGIARGRAVTLARTEILTAQRESSRRTMMMNSDILQEWTWSSATDLRTCPICWFMHGQKFPLSQKMATHPNCRCSMIPITKGWEDLGFGPGVTETRKDLEDGVDIFNSLTPSQQNHILGPAKYALYKHGQIRLADLVVEGNHPRWGPYRRQRTLKEIGITGRQVRELVERGRLGNETPQTVQGSQKLGEPLPDLPTLYAPKSGDRASIIDRMDELERRYKNGEIAKSTYNTQMYKMRKMLKEVDAGVEPVTPPKTPPVQPDPEPTNLLPPPTPVQPPPSTDLSARRNQVRAHITDTGSLDQRIRSMKDNGRLITDDPDQLTANLKNIMTKAEYDVFNESVNGWIGNNTGPTGARVYKALQLLGFNPDADLEAAFARGNNTHNLRAAEDWIRANPGAMEDLKSALAKQYEYTQEVLALDNPGGTFELQRGFGVARVTGGHPDSFTIKTLPAESWTRVDKVAQKFGDAVLKDTVKNEDILFSPRTLRRALTRKEDEFIVFPEGSTSTYSKSLLDTAGRKPVYRKETTGDLIIEPPKVITPKPSGDNSLKLTPPIDPRPSIEKARITPRVTGQDMVAENKEKWQLYQDEPDNMQIDEWGIKKLDPDFMGDEDQVDTPAIFGADDGEAFWDKWNSKVIDSTDRKVLEALLKGDPKSILDDIPVTKFDPLKAKLVSLQPTFSKNIVNEYLSGKRKSTDAGIVVKYGDVYHLVDGNHRAVARLIDPDKMPAYDAHVIDVDGMLHRAQEGTTRPPKSKAPEADFIEPPMVVTPDPIAPPKRIPPVRTISSDPAENRRRELDQKEADLTQRFRDGLIKENTYKTQLYKINKERKELGAALAPPEPIHVPDDVIVDPTDLPDPTPVQPKKQLKYVKTKDYELLYGKSDEELRLDEKWDDLIERHNDLLVKVKNVPDVNSGDIIAWANSVSELNNVRTEIAEINRVRKNLNLKNNLQGPEEEELYRRAAEIRADPEKFGHAAIVSLGHDVLTKSVGTPKYTFKGGELIAEIERTQHLIDAGVGVSFRTRMRDQMIEDLKRTDPDLHKAWSEGTLDEPVGGKRNEAIMREVRKYRSFGKYDADLDQEYEGTDSDIEYFRDNFKTSMLPTEWLEASALAGAFKVERTGKRGGYQPGMGHLGIRGDNVTDDTDTIIHEMVHRMEATNKRIGQLEQAFYTERTGSEQIKQIPGYGPTELYRKDHFALNYIGKDYRVSPSGYVSADSEYWELLSMGIEHMAGTNGAPIEHAKISDDDPEFIKWVIGMMLVA